MTVRRPPGRPALPRDRIIETALHIVDEEGADALSMRVLAQRLDSGTATLYRHFANRSQVIAHVVDRVFGEVELSVEALSALSWQQAATTVAHTMFDVLRRHRNVAPLLVEAIPIGPNALMQREILIAMLLDNGFSPKLAARAYATLARYVLGFAVQLTDSSAAGDGEAAETFRELNPDRFPATFSVAGHLPVPLDEEFAFGLELIIDGLTQLGQSSRGNGH